MKTPLYDAHVALGATMTDFAGWQMPVRYDSDLAEHHAVRNTAGVFDLSHMGEIEVSGPQAGAALDWTFVSRLRAIDIGRAKYTMLCTADGGVLDDVIVYRQDTDQYLIVANAANTAVVANEVVTRSAEFDATVTDRSADIALIAVQGPVARAVVATLAADDIEHIRPFRAASARVAGRDTWLARTGYTGEDGVEIYADTRDAATIWDAVLDTGRAHDLVPAGLACRDTLRLEAGMPLYGHELSAERTPFAAGQGRIVELDDHAFVGRDALVSASTPDEVLVGLAASGRRSPRAGNTVLADGNPVGAVTSGALSPTLGYPVAMAYVDAAVAEVDRVLDVDVRGTTVAATVVELPFYRR